MRTSHLLADQYPLVVIQVFYILYPRAWMFPQLWKVVSQYTLKLHRPLPELGLNTRHPLRGLKCWQLPIVTWSGSASISQHCSRDAMSKPTPGVHDTHTAGGQMAMSCGRCWLDIDYSLRIVLQQVGDQLVHCWKCGQCPLVKWEVVVGQMPPRYPPVCTWLQVSFSVSSF